LKFAYSLKFESLVQTDLWNPPNWLPNKHEHFTR